MKKHGEMIAAILSGLLTFVAWLMEASEPVFAIALFLAAYLIGGYVKAKEGWMTLWKEKEFDVNLLMFLAAIGAASIGYWMEGALLIFIFSLSGALESYTLARSEQDVTALMQMKPETARRYLSDHEEEVVPVEALNRGDWLIVRPGERIPADGKIREGETSVDQSMMTGESIPVEKSVRDEVFAGTINQAGLIVVEVTKTMEESLFSKIIQLMEQTRTDVPKSQQWIERLEKVYAKGVLFITILLMVLPHYILGWGWSDTLYRAMVFLVVASPCALVASIMPALLSAISKGARKGVLFKNGSYLELLSGSKVIAFDKTGTLTEGKPQVIDLIAFRGWREERLLQVVASIENGSDHPLAQAIVAFAKQKRIALNKPSSLQNQVGMGVVAEYEGERWRLGKPDLFSLSPQEQIMVNNLQFQGKTVILVERAGEVEGCITLQDVVRPETKATIRQLQEQGILTVMLTGDHQVPAEIIAEQSGVDLVYSGLLPQDKVRVIDELQAKYGQVVMIGDGINDSPALTKAPIGIAMGRSGSDVTLETADIVLMNDNLQRIPMLVQTGLKLQRVIKQNMIFALAVIAMLIWANFSQMMTLPLGVIGHEGSTLLVILNGLRLLR